MLEVVPKSADLRQIRGKMLEVVLEFADLRRKTLCILHFNPYLADSKQMTVSVRSLFVSGTVAGRLL